MTELIYFLLNITGILVLILMIILLVGLIGFGIITIYGYLTGKIEMSRKRKFIEDVIAKAYGRD